MRKTTDSTVTGFVTLNGVPMALCSSTVIRRIKFTVSTFVAATLLGGCVFLPQNLKYQGPQVRPSELNQYYNTAGGFSEFSDEVTSGSEGKERLIEISTPYGPVRVDYFPSGVTSKNLVFVFPILGGGYVIEKHFARYFAERGIDSAIIRRNAEFKDPDKIFEIEELFRQGVVRDRMTLDFFEQVYGKSEFASFGISRGGINVAILAGVDPRMKYNVIVMGGSNLVELMKDSDEPGVKKYRKRVQERKQITKEEFYTFLQSNIKTDPKQVAQYIDSRNTLMILAALDKTVPFRYGMQLRRQIGEPDTSVLFANHYTSLLYSQLAHVLLPSRDICLFPFDYIENEALEFYRRSFGIKGGGIKDLAFSVVKIPFGIFGAIRCLTNGDCRASLLSRYKDGPKRSDPREMVNRDESPETIPEKPKLIRAESRTW